MSVAQFNIDRAAMMISLVKCREQLELDNTKQAGDRAEMRNWARRLKKQIATARLIEKKIVDECVKLEDSDSRKQTLQDEILFPLRQRIIDLNTQLAGILYEILIIVTITKINRGLLAKIRKAIDVLEISTAQIGNMKTDETYSTVDLETAMSDLKEIAGRANKYDSGNRQTEQ